MNVHNSHSATTEAAAKRVVATTRSGSVAIVTIDRPHRMNALSADVRVALLASLRSIEADTSVRVVVLRGSGERAFASGGDIVELQHMGEAAARQTLVEFESVFAAVERLRLPVIAMIRGYALGGGCELAAACDLRIAASDAKLGVPIGRLGHTLDLASARRLVRLIGASKVKLLLWADRIIDAAEAHGLGLLDHVVPPDELEPYVMSLARTIGEKAPLGVAGTKQVLAHVAEHPLAEAGEDIACFAAPLFDSADFKEGVRAFLEKRKPSFVGR